jgi:crotonobetainyl-CoA:carnitine CoA-transferase CaiB-like acyl-CoA transferase
LPPCRIIDRTEALAGPYATMLLGDLGVDVIKIELPGVGDLSRKWGARRATQPASHWLSLLWAAEVPCGPIITVPDLLNHPHDLARQNLVVTGDLTTLANPLKLLGTPPAAWPGRAH